MNAYPNAMKVKFQSILSFFRGFEFELPFCSLGMKIVKGLRKAKIRLSLTREPTAGFCSRSFAVSNKPATYLLFVFSICFLDKDSGRINHRKNV